MSILVYMVILMLICLIALIRLTSLKDLSSPLHLSDDGLLKEMLWPAPGGPG
jgi:hypothetical protein